MEPAVSGRTASQLAYVVLKATDGIAQASLVSAIPTYRPIDDTVLRAYPEIAAGQDGGSLLQRQQRVRPMLYAGACRKLTQSSYLEGIVRGYRNGLLTTPAYNNLTQCETIDGAVRCLLRRETTILMHYRSEAPAGSGLWRLPGLSASESLNLEPCLQDDRQAHL